MRVWDPLVRIFHWSLVASFGVAWFTSHASEDIHEGAGYLAAALVLVRLPVGRAGHALCALLAVRPRSGDRGALSPGHARRPRGPLYRAQSGRRRHGAGADGGDGGDRANRLDDDDRRLFRRRLGAEAHDLIAHGLLLLVFVHVGGVVLASVRHRENLVAAMITGRKRKAAAEDVA